MKKLLNTKLKEMKAITLIALVITIVVLIILAGVIISITLGNGGIIDRAKTAKEEYANAQGKEEKDIAEYSNKIDEYSGFTRAGGSSVKYSLKEQEIGTWVDNSPLYEKTINFGAYPNKTTKSVAHGISNLGRVVDISGTYWEGTTWQAILQVHDRDVKNQSMIWVDNTNISVTNRDSDVSGYTDCYITLRYTKASS